MKRIISSGLILILLFCHHINVFSSGASEVSEENFLCSYERVELPFIEEAVYLVNQSGHGLFDNSLSGDSITSSICDADIMFPKGSGNYLTMRIYKTDSEFSEVFRITPFDTKLTKSGIEALGIEEYSGDTSLVSQKSSGFKSMYDRWNKIRLTFSSTNNKTGIWFNGLEAKFTIKDTKSDSFASGGAYRVSLYMGYDSSLGADTGVYTKNGRAYTAYLNATNQTERDALADRTGRFRYRYDDGSGDFLYEIKTDMKKNTGYAVITGLDPNKCTKEIEEPVIFDYSLPSFADGYPVRAIGESAFEGLSGMERFDIPPCITDIRRNAFAYSEFDTLILRGDATLFADAFSSADIDNLVFLGDVRLNDNPFESHSTLAQFGNGATVIDKTYNGKTELKNAKYDTSFAYGTKKGSLSWVFGDHRGFVVQIPYESSYTDNYDSINIRYYCEMPGQKITYMVNEYNTFAYSDDGGPWSEKLVTGEGWQTISVSLAEVKKRWIVDNPEYIYVFFISGWSTTVGTKEEYDAGTVDAISGTKMYLDSIWLDGANGEKVVSDFSVGAEMYDYAGSGLSRGLISNDVAFRYKTSSLAWTFNNSNGLIIKLPFDESFKTKYEFLVIRYYAQIPGQTFGIGINEKDHWGSQTINKYLTKNVRVSGKWEECRISVSEIMNKWDDETSDYLYLQFDSKWFGVTPVKKENFNPDAKQAIIGEKLYIDSIWLENTEPEPGSEISSNAYITPVSSEGVSGICRIYAGDKSRAMLEKALNDYGAFNSIWIDTKASKAYVTGNENITLIDVYCDDSGNISRLAENDITEYKFDFCGNSYFDIDLSKDENLVRKIYVWNSISGAKPYSPSVIIYP